MSSVGGYLFFVSIFGRVALFEWMDWRDGGAVDGGD